MSKMLYCTYVGAEEVKLKTVRNTKRNRAHIWKLAERNTTVRIPGADFPRPALKIFLHEPKAK